MTEREPTLGPDLDARVADLSARYWDAFVEAHPLAATSYGDRRHDDRVDDLRSEAIASTRARFATLLDEVRAVATVGDAVATADDTTGSVPSGDATAESRVT